MKLFSSVSFFFNFNFSFYDSMFDDYYLLVVKIKSLRRNDYECEVLIVRLNSASEFKRIVPMRIYLRIKNSR